MYGLFEFLTFLAGITAGYLVGSIPSAYIYSKWVKGIDIRQHGSGNIGATNTFRVLGKGAGILVLMADIAKGLLATTLVADVFGGERISARLIIGVFAVVGHNWTLFLNFKGGKGIATSLGVLIGLTLREAALRPVLAYTLLCWLIVFFTTGFVSLASIIASIALPFLMTLSHQSFPLILLGTVFCVFVVIRHKANIRRLIAREEPRVYFPFGRRPRP